MKNTRPHTTNIRVTSFILTLLLIFYTVPAAVFAEVLTDSAVEEQGVTDSTENTVLEEPKKHKEVFEVTELREENTKHFRLEDGTYLAASYVDPVHYKDEEGNWQDIDNRLFLLGSEFSTTDAKIKFSKKITGNENLFTLRDGNTKITMSLIGANKKTEGKVTTDYLSDDLEETKLGKLMNLEKLMSKVLYEDILDGVDVEYVVHSRNIKENIIVKERAESYSYSFELKLNGLQAALDDEGNVILCDDGENAKYRIPAPIVYDAVGQLAPSGSAYYTLSESGKKIVLTVTVDSEWMNADERAFPITVDPTVSSGNSGVTDLYISSDAPDLNFASSVYLELGYLKQAYWKTDQLPALPPGAYISKATITMTLASGWGNYVAAFMVTGSWDSSHTWSARYSAPFFSVPDDHVLTEAAGQYSWNVTRTVKEWYSGSSNYGIGFKHIYGYSADPISRFYSNDYTTAGYRPSLSIYYVDSLGLEDYLSYSSQSAGSAGVGSINLSNGNLVFNANTLSTTDYLMTTTSTLVYNSSLAGKEYSSANVTTAKTSSYTPLGFKLNLGETIVKKTVTVADGSQTVYYVYSDSDGTSHYFSKVNGLWTDEDGLGLELTEGTQLIIKDKNKTVKEFSAYPSSYGSGWYLAKVTDKVGNSVTINVDSNYRPSSISLTPKNAASTQMLTFTYNSSGKLSAVRNNTSGEAAVLMYSDTYNGTVSASATKYLRQVIYAVRTTESDSSWNSFCSSGSTSYLVNNSSDPSYVTSSYTYDSQGRLTEILDGQSGGKLTYTYSANSVATAKEYDRSLNKGAEISLTIGDGYSRLRSSGANDVYGDSDDIYTTYTLDIYGRVISYYSSDVSGASVTGAKTGKYETQDNVKNNIKETTTVGGSPVNYILNGSFESWPSSSEAPTYWMKTSTNVQRSYNTGMRNDSYVAKINAKAGVTDELYQYVYLPVGNYTLSLKYNSSSFKNVSLYLEVSSLTSGSVIATKELGRDYKYETDNMTEAVTFAVGNLSNGGENVKVTVRVTGDSNLTGYPSVTLDNLVLTESVAASPRSFVEGGHFESTGINANGVITTPISDIWPLTQAEIASASAPFGKVLKINADIYGTKESVQRIYVANSDIIAKFNTTDFSSNAGVEYVVSGFGYTTDLISSCADFGIRIDVYYYQGYDKEDVKISHFFEFQSIEDSWQFLAGTFSGKYTPEDSSDTTNYTCIHYIDVACVLSGQPAGYVYFDNIVVADRTEYGNYKYEYNADGTVNKRISSTTNQYYRYDGNKNLIQVANDRGEMTRYWYDANSQVIREAHYSFKNSIGTKSYPYVVENPVDGVDIFPAPLYMTEYTYLPQGLVSGSVTGIALEGVDGNPYFATTDKIEYSYGYSTAAAIYGAPLSESDKVNATVYNVYDQKNGRLMATIRDGVGTSYTYTTLGRLKGAKPATGLTATYTPVENKENVNYTYNSYGELTSITTDSTTYAFTYDGFGNSNSVKAGDKTLATYEYNPNNGKLIKVNYGNGYFEEYVYNSLEMLSEVWYNYSDGSRECAVKYSYTSDGSLAGEEDVINGIFKVYVYDSKGRLSEVGEYSAEDNYYYLDEYYLYESYDRVSMVSYTLDYAIPGGISSSSISNSYSYNDNGSIRSSYVNLGKRLSSTYTYDRYERFKEVEYSVSGGFSNHVTLEYRKNSADERYHLANEIASYTSVIGSGATTVTTENEYTYDARGNITGITVNGSSTTYVYDDLGQLVRENNQALGKTYTYTYDSAGNILSRKTYNYTTASSLGTPTSTDTYGYSTGAWGDQLTSYNGTSITYDSIGNPLSFYNGISYILGWEGRQLVSARMNNMDYTFEYNSDGQRIRKTVGGTEYFYYYAGDRLIAQKWGPQLMVFLYDATGLPVGIAYRTSSEASGTWTNFWFERNLQGDVVAIYDNANKKLVSYTYDAWGNHKETYYNSGFTFTAVLHNPIRYRGYYYDVDLGLYYLQTRYYDSNIGRFISPDHPAVITATPASLTDKNLYAYCDNNPVMRVDGGGQFWDYVLDVGFIAWGITDIINDPGDWKNWAALAIDIVFAVVPFVPSGGGQVIKVGNKIDNALDIAGSLNKIDNVQDATKITMIGRNMDRVTNTANLIGKADNLYKAWKGYDNTATGMKRILHNGISMAHNGGWLFGKLRQGYTVIDIGLPTMCKGRGLWYGTERFALSLWKTRNIWKAPVNYYS